MLTFIERRSTVSPPASAFGDLFVWDDGCGGMAIRTI